MQTKKLPLTALALVAAAAALGGCNKVKSCKQGTVLLDVEVPTGVDELQVTVSVDSMPMTPQSVRLPAGGTSHGTIELDFSSYPAGHAVAFAVTALAAGTEVGSAETDVHALAAGCDAVTVTITAGGALDLSMESGDLAGADLAGTDIGPAGCMQPTDCPTGQACDVAQHKCTTACSSMQTCNGGCCDGALCVAGTAVDKCGSNGGTCAACPTGQACSAGACGVSCSATAPCNGGCCDTTTMKCAAGTANTECALGGALCGTCAANAAGKACLTSGSTTTCGCSSATDCPTNQACNTTTHTCSTACDSSTPCNGGCCSAATAGTCQLGNLNTACGNNGSVCTGCSADQNGHVCIGVAGGGQCGCNTIGDCPGTSSMCDAAGKLCVNACSSTTPCQNGCCSSASSGVCGPGTGDTSCGVVGSVCASCAANANGHVCLATKVCGCTQRTDCPAGNACDTSTGKCTTACSSTQQCNGGCCSAMTGGTCQAGNLPADCGNSGVCAVCTTSGNGHLCQGGSCQCNGPADCPANTACDVSTHTCTTACSSTQTCNGGCCSATTGGTCQPGTAQGACGNSGVCAACNNNNNGHQCVSFACGCNNNMDCPSLNACSAAHQCTSSCSSGSPCNTGCCSAAAGGTCQAGNSNAECGAAGAICVSCTSPQTCGGGGTANACGCTKTSCAGHCGVMSDGCGSTEDCGTGQCGNYACAANNICKTSCTAVADCSSSFMTCSGGMCCETCNSEGFECGPFTNSCGAVINCGACCGNPCACNAHTCAGGGCC